MHKVSINIPKKFWPFKWTKKIKGYYPEEWNEMSRKQYVGVIRLLHSSLSSDNFRIDLVAIMLGLSTISKLLLWANFKCIKGTKTNFSTGYELEEEARESAAIQMVQLWWLFRWVQTDITLTKNLIPWIKTSFFGGNLYGPEDELGTLTAEEWMWIDRFYMSWRTDNNFEDLYRMIACMYRPKGNITAKSVNFTGDIREPFNINRIDSWVNDIKQAVEGKGLLRFTRKAATGEAELLAIMHWYESCRHQIVKQFDRVFTGENETNAEDYGWPAVFMTIAKEGPFGNLEKVNRERVQTVLLHMQARAKEAEELRIEREKNS